MKYIVPDKHKHKLIERNNGSTDISFIFLCPRVLAYIGKYKRSVDTTRTALVKTNEIVFKATWRCRDTRYIYVGCSFSNHK